MNRRRVLLLGALGAIVPARVCSQGRQVRIGFLSPGKDTFVIPVIVQALAEHGYRDGAEAVLVQRYAEDVETRYPRLAKELVDAKCDVIFALGNDLPVRALMSTKTDISIVFLAINYDPLEKGIVTSLGRPGRNITGVYLPTGATGIKRLELAREILPGTTKFLVLSDANSKDQLAQLRRAATAQAIQLTVVEHDKEPYDLSHSFDIGRKAGVQAVLLLTSRRLAQRREEVGALALAHRLPAFGGGTAPQWLASYTLDLKAAAQQVTQVAIRILKGAKPSDLPIVQPDEYETIVNLRMAKTLGIKIPVSVLVRATKVIE